MTEQNESPAVLAQIPVHATTQFESEAGLQAWAERELAEARVDTKAKQKLALKRLCAKLAAEEEE